MRFVKIRKRVFPFLSRIINQDFQSRKATQLQELPAPEQDVRDVAKISNQRSPENILGTENFT